MMAASYPTKKALKEAIGKRLRYVETSMYGEEYKPNVMLTVVGPSPYERKWFANVWTDDNGIITKVK